MAPIIGSYPKECGCNREEALTAQPAKLRTQCFFFTEKVTQLSRHEFLEFFFQKAAFANSVRLFVFFPPSLSFSNVRKTSYWIPSLLERSDFSRLDSKIPVKKTRGCHCLKCFPPEKNKEKADSSSLILS